MGKQKQEPLLQIGWWVWHAKQGAHHKTFCTQSLTEDDKRNGYVAQPVYVKPSEDPTD